MATQPVVDPTVVEKKPCVAVREAIANFVARKGFKIVPKRSNESSVIFKWGVRVVLVTKAAEDSTADVEPAAAIDSITDDMFADSLNENDANAGNNATGTSSDKPEPAVGWFCLAEEDCCKAKKIIGLPRGLTSKATKHLGLHGIVGRKTLSEAGTKRQQDDEFELLSNSGLYRNDPTRLLLLLETRRIVFHNLPFEFANYEETKLLDRLTSKPDFVHSITPSSVRHSIVEMYVTAKREVISYLKENKLHGLPCFSLVADFWTSPIKQTKYLGVRVYLIDQDWQLKSVHLGTREFSPSYAERLKGMRVAFERWVKELLADFELKPADMFASTTDGGADVRRMMTETFNLKWQWCIPHLSNAATKAACGMHNNSKKKSKNPDMQTVVRLMSRVVYIVSSNEVMGSLWTDLCMMFGRNFRKPSRVHDFSEDGETKASEDDGTDDEDQAFLAYTEGEGADETVNMATKLLNFQSHRFMGLVRMIRSILSKWKPLKLWFKEVGEKAKRLNKPVPYEFPLKKHNKVLVQLLSLLQPVEELNRKSQAEQANQVEVLLELYILRLKVLDPNEPLPHFLSSADCPILIPVTSIKPVVAKTRRMLFNAFEKKFFSRYIGYARIKKEPFVLEAQLFLNPRYKDWELSLEQVVRVCSLTAGMDPEAAATHVEDVCEQIIARVKLQMTELGKALRGQPRTSQEPVPVRQPNRLSMFVSESKAPVNPRQAVYNSIDDELARWKADKDDLRELPSGRDETILEFWRRKSSEPGYVLLPLVVRMFYSAPTSSAQIERDFGLSGMLVTKTRNRLSGPNIDMCAFLNSNRKFVDVTQVGKLTKKEANSLKPRISVVELAAQIDAEIDSMFTQSYSSMNVSGENFESADESSEFFI